MFEELKSLSLNELLVKIYEVDRFYKIEEINSIYSAILMQINKEFDCDFEYIVGSKDEIFHNNKKVVKYDYSKNLVLINTDAYRLYKRKYNDKDLLVKTQIIASIIHEMAHIKQHEFYKENVELFLNAPTVFSGQEKNILTNFIHDHKLGLYNLRKLNGKEDHMFYFQYIENVAFEREVNLTLKILKDAYENSGKKVYLKAYQAFSKSCDKEFEKRIKSARKAYPHLNDKEIIETIKNKVNDDGLQIANKIISAKRFAR